MRVRTAASASSREGFGATGWGADRTWSDRGLSDRGDFGQGLTTASIRGLSVRPAQKAGGVTGVAASVIRALGDSTHARRPDAAFPFYMAPCSLAKPCRPVIESPARAGRPVPIYSSEPVVQSRDRPN